MPTASSLPLPCGARAPSALSALLPPCLAPPTPPLAAHAPTHTQGSPPCLSAIVCLSEVRCPPAAFPPRVCESVMGKIETASRRVWAVGCAACAAGGRARRSPLGPNAGSGRPAAALSAPMAPSNVQQLDPYAVGRISEMSGRPRANEVREPAPELRLPCPEQPAGPCITRWCCLDRQRRRHCLLLACRLPAAAAANRLPLPLRAQARELLEAVARQVQPIMRRRQLTVPSLVEFFPDNSNLLVSAGGWLPPLLLPLLRAQTLLLHLWVVPVLLPLPTRPPHCSPLPRRASTWAAAAAAAWRSGCACGRRATRPASWLTTASWAPCCTSWCTATSGELAGGADAWGRR